MPEDKVQCDMCFQSISRNKLGYHFFSCHHIDDFKNVNKDALKKQFDKMMASPDQKVEAMLPKYKFGKKSYNVCLGCKKHYVKDGTCHSDTECREGTKAFLKAMFATTTENDELAQLRKENEELKNKLKARPTAPSGDQKTLQENHDLKEEIAEYEANEAESRKDYENLANLLMECVGFNPKEDTPQAVREYINDLKAKKIFKSLKECLQGVDLVTEIIEAAAPPPPATYNFDGMTYEELKEFGAIEKKTLDKLNETDLAAYTAAMAAKEPKKIVVYRKPKPESKPVEPKPQINPEDDLDGKSLEELKAILAMKQAQAQKPLSQFQAPTTVTPVVLQTTRRIAPKMVGRH